MKDSEINKSAFVERLNYSFIQKGGYDYEDYH